MNLNENVNIMKIPRTKTNKKNKKIKLTRQKSRDEPTKPNFSFFFFWGSWFGFNGFVTRLHVAILGLTVRNFQDLEYAVLTFAFNQHALGKLFATLTTRHVAEKPMLA